MIKRDDVQVKGLDWETPDQKFVHISKSPLGIVAITKVIGADMYELCCYGQRVNVFESVDLAKQAAKNYVRDVVLSLIEFD